MVHASFGAKKVNNVWSGEGSTQQNVSSMHCNDGSRESLSLSGPSILNRVRRGFDKVWRREQGESLTTEHLLSSDRRWPIEPRGSDSGWLNYFTQRSTNTPTLGSVRNTQRVRRHRKIVRTLFDGTPVEKKETKPSVRFHGIRRSISLPSDEMAKLHLNLRRSASSKSVLRTINQEDDENTRFYTPEDKTVEQTKDFCRDVIIQTLKRNNLFNRVKINRPVSVDQWITNEVQTICTELERRNPTLCRHISKQLGITLRSEEVLRKVFFEFALEIVSNDAPRCDNTRSSVAQRRNSRAHLNETNRKKVEITWGRIMAVFVIAGAFAIDCIKQGHSELIADLIQICGEFFLSEGVVEWIISKGGWETLCDVNSTKIRDPDPTNAWNALFVTALLAASIAIGIGISNLSLGDGGV